MSKEHSWSKTSWLERWKLFCIVTTIPKKSASKVGSNPHLHSLSEPQGTLLRLAAMVTFCTMACSFRHFTSSISFSVISFMPISWPAERGARLSHPDVLCRFLFLFFYFTPRIDQRGEDSGVLQREQQTEEQCSVTVLPSTHTAQKLSKSSFTFPNIWGDLTSKLAT